MQRNAAIACLFLNNYSLLKMRQINLAFDCHQIIAPNSPTQNVMLEIDVILSGGATIAKAITIVGTVGAINSVDDNNFIPIDGSSSTFTHSTPNGDLTITTNFPTNTDLYNSVRMDSWITDHLGFKSITPVCRPTNLIVSHTGNHLQDENATELIYIAP